MSNLTAQAKELFAELSAQAKLPEVLDSSVQVTPKVLGQLLMNAVGTEGTGPFMSIEQKIFWMNVGEYIGSDYIQELRRISAFMDKANSF